MHKKAILVGVVLLAIVGGILWKLKAKPASDNTDTSAAKKRVAEPVNVIPLEERPVARIIPEADGHNLSLEMIALNKSASEAEYELEYQAGTLLQGAFGALNLGTLPTKTKVLLGSCSAGGACTYHEDVQGGNLLWRLSGDENYAVKQDWRYIDNLAKETQISSKDAKFQLTATGLKTVRYLVVYNSPGYPTGLKATVDSEVYVLAGSSQLTGSGELVIRANEESPDLSIYGWDGDTWTKFESEIDGKMVTAEINLSSYLFVAAK